MTAFAPASTSILAVPSPRPDAPPVTINVLPLSCMGSPSSLLRALLLLGHQPRAVAQERIQAALRDEISPALELFLALHLLDELLAPFLELLVVLRLVFRFLALRGRARPAGLAGHRHPDVVIVARLLADSQGVARAVDGIGLDDARMIEPGIALGGAGARARRPWRLSARRSCPRPPPCPSARADPDGRAGSRAGVRSERSSARRASREAPRCDRCRPRSRRARARSSRSRRARGAARRPGRQSRSRRPRSSAGPRSPSARRANRRSSRPSGRRKRPRHPARRGPPARQAR